MIRYLGERNLLPNVPGLVERRSGKTYIHAWAGFPEDPATQASGVRWIQAIDWVPYQLPTFVTPAFAGYVSGHSTFSRSAAEVLTGFTGSSYFPGGLYEVPVPRGALKIEEGPSRDLKLQWATYYDAADAAGQSRLWMGIHVAGRPRAGGRLPVRQGGMGVGTAPLRGCCARRTIGVAMLGYAFMGKAHSRALQALRRLDVPLRSSSRSRDATRSRGGAREVGWADAVTDWREQVADERGAALRQRRPERRPPSPASRRHGTASTSCARSRSGSRRRNRTGCGRRPNGPASCMCGFNYRFVPAVRLVRELLDAETRRRRHFRARYLQSWGWDADESAWRFDPQAGTGALGDLGTHRRPRALSGRRDLDVSASVRTLVPGRKVDDHFVTVEFENGVAGRSRPRASPGAASTRTRSRSTGRSARRLSTSSG